MRWYCPGSLLQVVPPSLAQLFKLQPKVITTVVITAIYCGYAPDVFSASVSSAPQALSSYSPQTLVITGTRTERALIDTPVRTEVISAQQISRVHAKDLTEALQYVPGLQLRPIHGKTGYGAWLQGIDSNRVLILVDGNPVAASTGSAVDTSQIAVSSIERIEIIKGAVSALYGTAAMGGVINIITQQASQPLSASATLSSGSWGSQNSEDFPLAQRHAKAQIAINRPNWSLNLMGDLRNQDAWQVDPNSNSTQGYDGSKVNLAGQVQYRFTPNLKFTLAPRYYHEDLLNGMPDEFNPGFGWTQANKKEVTSTQHLSARLEHSFGQGFNWQLNLMGEKFSGETAQDRPATTYVDQQRDTEINHYLAAVQLTEPLGSNTLTLGAQAAAETMDVVQIKRSSNSYERIIEVDNEDANTLEAFAQFSWMLGHNLELLPGFRLHRDSEFGNHLAPMLNGMFYHTFSQGDRINVRLGVGNGYRVPNLKERFYVFDHSHLGYKVMGNSALEPESSISYQAGVEWLRPSGSRLELSLFHNDIDDLIESDLDAAESSAQNLQIYRYQNFDQALTQGVELVGLVPFTSNLALDFGYTWMHTEDKTTGNQLPDRPKHQLKLGLTWTTPWPGLELTLKGRHESRQYTNAANTTTSPAFNVFDVKTNYSWNQHWSLFAGINNLSNVQKNFAVADNRPEEGRFIYAGINWRL